MYRIAGSFQINIGTFGELGGFAEDRGVDKDYTMLPTILISLLIGFAAAIALGVCITSIALGLRRGKEIRAEMIAMDARLANSPYVPVQMRGLWATS